MTVIHTDIHTYTKKRKKEKEKRTDKATFVIYDMDKYKKLAEFALMNDTNVSSIINNLYEALIEIFENESPQKNTF